MPQSSKVSNGGADAEEEKLLKAYQWNFEAEEHEFDLLHHRTAHLINSNYLFIAIFATVFGVSFAHFERSMLAYLACLLLTSVAVLGFISSFLSYSSVKEAIIAIKRYLQNQQKIEGLLGPNHPFFKHTSLGRTPDSIGNYAEHEKSLIFHRFLPTFYCIFWILLFISSIILTLIKEAPR